MSANSSTAAAEPLLIDINEVARLTGFSRGKLYSMQSTGAMPAPLKVGRSTRWRRADIEAWVDLGCPKRDEFERRQNRK